MAKARHNLIVVQNMIRSDQKRKGLSQIGYHLGMYCGRGKEGRSCMTITDLYIRTSLSENHATGRHATTSKEIYERSRNDNSEMFGNDGQSRR